MSSPRDETWEVGVYVISVAAQLSGLHPQTLRQYDRLGLVSPGRASGRGRRYSARDIERLREVARLSQEEGVNLAGIKRILDLENANDELRMRIAELEAELAFVTAALREKTSEATSPNYRRVNLPAVYEPPPSAVVVWRRETRRPGPDLAR
ncbi:heat shock protein transcriptional repressor HspR [Sporichthya polymorpha]|uniref:heat shock protein transcriptional repressor HspR n=1 Tax=Sporichthya polymorpha TaxID=35751 RepID=UPI00036821AE|nr:helix-turn-helix transcriptional regulator [Sporichthya polymorpha]